MIKTSLTVAVAALALLAGSASAASLTRAQVVEQLQQARAAGQLYTGENQPYPISTNVPSNVSRSAVLAQLEQYKGQHPHQPVEH
ncbi:DUF4148 domain-containing protein [Paralcaligenes ureilyticus]|uniref:Uncharacterized protein DUF4148 n=1 Tax=Paralcaligenes ureilyticus TaxID=627131 RepID=A0A4R3M023_9BURK|nr:DUF4148 domain-containing protein [Paralcaligenes ureilyticus]TCT06340.1 uncharacterized protein DUF4148 [Paralcaligenes ureilyticus]